MNWRNSDVTSWTAGRCKSPASVSWPPLGVPHAGTVAVPVAFLSWLVPFRGFLSCEIHGRERRPCPPCPEELAGGARPRGAASVASGRRRLGYIHHPLHLAQFSCQMRVATWASTRCTELPSSWAMTLSRRSIGDHCLTACPGGVSRTLTGAPEPRRSACACSGPVGQAGPGGRRR